MYMYVHQVAVAIKRLYGRQEVQSQFIKEANSMCSLDHPNIIRLYGIVLSEPLMLVSIFSLTKTSMSNFTYMFALGIYI